MKKKLWMIGLTAVFSLSMAMVSFAGWVQDGKDWYYYHDRNGSMITDEWIHSNGHWYYMESNGKMAVSRMIDETYYVNSGGVRVENEWRMIYGDWDKEETGWRYFTGNGKLYVDGMKEINDAWYYFEDGVMKTGWIEYGDHTYYFKNSGVRATGWRWLSGPDEDDWSEGWYYFTSSGKMLQGCKKSIDGKSYMFNENGRMLSGWVNPDDLTSSGSGDLSDEKIENLMFFEDDGSAANGWIEMPSLDDAEDYWFYFKDGKAYSTNYKTTVVDRYGMAKIGNHYYCFDREGRMITGLIQLQDGRYFFFNEKDGAMRTGRTVISNDEFEHQEFYFATTGGVGKRGAGVTGVKEDRVYKNGLLLRAEDGMKYAVVEIEVDGEKEQYLVNENGKIKTKGTVKDGDGVKYEVTKSGGKYHITIVKD